jgi:hypothetical protein
MIAKCGQRFKIVVREIPFDEQEDAYCENCGLGNQRTPMHPLRRVYPVNKAIEEQRN